MTNSIMLFVGALDCYLIEQHGCVFLGEEGPLFAVMVKLALAGIRSSVAWVLTPSFDWFGPSQVPRVPTVMTSPVHL